MALRLAAAVDIAVAETYARAPGLTREAPMRSLLTVALTLSLALSPGCGGDDDPDVGSADAGAASGSDTNAGTDTGASGDTTAEGEDTEAQAPDGCRSHEACLADDGSQLGLYCATPFDDNVCGRGPAEGCGSHEGCPGEMMCHQFFDDCSPGNVGRRCDSPCTDFPGMCSESGEDFVCDDDGACVGQSCLDGYACHAVQFCDPEAEGADVHGCNFVDCQADADCDAGLFCVLDRCLGALGTCSEHSMVP